MRRFTLAALMLLVLVSSVVASGGRRSRRGTTDNSGWTQVDGGTVMSSAPVQSAGSPTTPGADDAMDEVNAKRASMGLRPFINDPLLTQAALACAKERAARHCRGHLPSDFAYLPPGGQATAAGCGALEDSWGWGTCCYTENYTYAGAAWVRGSDNLRYMHIFVR